MLRIVTLVFNMQVWRNWQTRMVQVHMNASSCRFKSCYLHQTKIIRTLLQLEMGSDLFFFATIRILIKKLKRKVHIFSHYISLLCIEIHNLFLGIKSIYLWIINPILSICFSCLIQKLILLFLSHIIADAYL